MAAGNLKVAALTQDYLRIMIFGAPLPLMLGIHVDALRREGKAALVDALSLLVNLFHIGANWLGTVALGLVMPRSALGTVAAQARGLAGTLS